MDNVKITAKDLRKQCHNGGERADCYVCGKHSLITHKHHVLPLEKCARWLDLGIETISIPTVWLCPNCHAYIHFILRRYEVYKVIEAMSGDENKKIMEILKIHDELENELYKKVMEANPWI